MIQFVDLENGFLYNGDKPYVFWFDGGLSVDLIYSKSIGLLCDKKNINVTIPKNNIFSIIDINYILNAPNDFKNSLRNEYISEGESVNGKYFHILYFSSNSNMIGEFKESFYIDNQEFTIGADFYDENESLRINLSNFGVEIPNSIQKAIYETNIQEDNKDNILLNRKFKELLSNYWDVLANKGSYKSLFNSMKWFEYGDIVRLNEVWKQYTTGKTIFSTESIKSILNNEYEYKLINFSKTTYIALYAAMQEIIENEYDEEMNPALKNISIMWSKEEMSLKMSLFGYFYEHFFMPIHLDLLHSTIEDIVFTNNIKIQKGSVYNRVDEVYDFDYVKCNIDDNSCYFIGNVQAQVGPDTIFGTQWNGESNYSDIYTLGAQNVINKEYVNELYNDSDVKTFGSQLYTGVGAIVPIELSIPINKQDFIKQTIISVKNKQDNWRVSRFYTLFNNIVEDNGKYYINIDFNMLCKVDGDYIVKFMFITGDSKIYTKYIKFNIIDPSSLTLKLYRIMHKQHITIADLINKDELSQYIFKRYLGGKEESVENLSYAQYLPVSKDGGGLRLNHMIILRGDKTNNEWFKKNYFIITRIAKLDNNNEVLYTICISKSFNYKPGYKLKEELKKYINNDLVREDYIFIPQYHYLIPFGGKTLLDYTISRDIPLVIVPEIKFGKWIKEYEWEFENTSTLESFVLPSIQEPMFASSESEILPNGFYNIIFRYSLVDGRTNEIKLTSAFLKK